MEEQYAPFGEVMEEKKVSFRKLDVDLLFVWLILSVWFAGGVAFVFSKEYLSALLCLIGFFGNIPLLFWVYKAKSLKVELSQSQKVHLKDIQAIVDTYNETVERYNELVSAIKSAQEQQDMAKHKKSRQKARKSLRNGVKDVD